MKFRTWAVATTAGTIGYVLGTAAGRERFEQIKAGAQQLTQNPTVQQNLSNFADTVATKAETMNPKVGGVVKSAAQQVQSRVGGGQDAGSSAPVTTPTTGATFAASPLDETYQTSPLSDYDDTIPPTSTPGTSTL